MWFSDPLTLHTRQIASYTEDKLVIQNDRETTRW